jgi:drug/metabolite transporter (DMT)-like permease
MACTRMATYDPGMTSALISPPAAGKAPALLVPALLACYLVWGSTYLAIRFALLSFPPFFQMGTRFLAAGILLMAWVLARGHKLPSRREWANAAIIGTLMLGGGMGLTASAEVHIGSGLIATFIAIVPMLVSAWGLLLGQRPSRLEFIGMAVGLAGVLMLVQGASFARRRWGWPASRVPRCCGRSARCCPPRGCRWPPAPRVLPAKCCVAARC